MRKSQHSPKGALSDDLEGPDPLHVRASWPVPSGMRLEFGLARSPGNMKVSFQAARSIG